MNYYTIDFNSGGNHGHLLKDYFGGITIGHLFNLQYVHTPFSYLDYFAIGYQKDKLNKWLRKLKFKNVVKVKGPYWNGISDYDTMLNRLAPIFNTPKNNTLFVFKNALRIHPFQTIPWYKNNQIEKPIFLSITQEVSNNFKFLHPSISENQKKTVAIHISRGQDFDKKIHPIHFTDSTVVRYMFSLSYFEHIIFQLRKVYGKGNIQFSIYTEKLNSEDIVDTFRKEDDVTLHIGPNRSERQNTRIHEIFSNFVSADILVTCNSSFSVVAAYYRYGKQTIYHPHIHLNHLPEPEYLATDILGNFNTNLLVT